MAKEEQMYSDAHSRDEAAAFAAMARGAHGSAIEHLLRSAGEMDAAAATLARWRKFVEQRLAAAGDIVARG